MTEIGSDESLKGDTFGGLVVAAAFVDETIKSKLLVLGVRDSKKISDKVIQKIAPQIATICPNHIISYLPQQYNQHTLTALMNALHKECYDKVKAKTQQAIHIVDLYPGCTVGDIKETKAESKYLSVAAASILARWKGLEQFETLSKNVGFVIPKGSTHVSEALFEIKKKQLDPALFVKLHFSNVKKVFAGNQAQASLNQFE